MPAGADRRKKLPLGCRINVGKTVFRPVEIWIIRGLSGMMGVLECLPRGGLPAAAGVFGQES